MNDRDTSISKEIKKSYGFKKTTEYALLIPLMTFMTIVIMGIFAYFLYDFYMGISESIPEVNIQEESLVDPIGDNNLLEPKEGI